MQEELEKTIDRDDFHALFRESVRQGLEKEKKEKVDRLFKYFSLVITSLTPIAIFFGTNLIAEQQKENTAIIAKQQQANANVLNDRQIINARLIADSGLQIERLKNITTIYKDIIIHPKDNDDNKKKVEMMIISLDAYKNESLRFLLNLQKNYEKSYPTLAAAAKQSIINITSKHQIKLYDMDFIGDNPEDKMNMRQTVFKEYNLSNTTFENVNLFRSDFTGSTLHGAEFKNVDLYSAIFAGSNLTGATFRNTNLRKANFKKANLKDMHIINCELEGAEFSLGSLLKTKEPPFSELLKDESGIEKYTFLLTPHLEKLKQEKNATMLENISKALGLKEDILIEKLEKRKEENKTYSATPSSSPRVSVFNNPVLQASSP
jgi:hypothetical protein